MDVNSLRLLMEINTLHTFGAVRSFTENSGMFSGLLTSVLNTQDSDSAFQRQAGLSAGSPAIRQGLSGSVLAAASAPEPLSGEKRTDRLDAVIAKAAQTYNVPEKLVRSVIRQESGFNPSAVSHAGASGLMQLMPGTARFLGVQNPLDPEQNVMGGTKYLRQLLDQFGGDTKTALAAYNAGPGNVRKYGGVPPFKETQNYVRKVMDSYLS